MKIESVRWSPVTAFLVGLLACGNESAAPSSSSEMSLPITTTTTRLATTFATSSTEASTIFKAAIADEDGVRLLTDDGSTVQVTAEPSAFAFVFGDGRIAWQAADPMANLYPPSPIGSVFFGDANESLELPYPEGFDAVALLDAGHINGRVVALVNASLIGNPEDELEELMIFRLDDQVWQSLGVSGGYEAGTRSARLTDTGVASVSEGEGVELVEWRNLEGEEVWRTEPVAHSTRTIARAIGVPEVVVVRSGFDESLRPLLEISKLNESDGTERTLSRLELELADDLSIGGGFCFAAELQGSKLVCDQTYGSPLAINIETGQTVAFEGLDDGVVTLVRFAL